MEFSRPVKSGQERPSIKCKFWKCGPRPTAARNGGFGGLRPRADGAWAAAGMAVEGLLEWRGGAAMLAKWPRPGGARAPRAPAVEPPSEFRRFEFCFSARAFDPTRRVCWRAERAGWPGTVDPHHPMDWPPTPR